MSDQKTIFALATPQGKSGVAVIRISGKEAANALRAYGVKELPKPRVATLSSLIAPLGGALAMTPTGSAARAALERYSRTHRPRPHPMVSRPQQLHRRGLRGVAHTWQPSGDGKRIFGAGRLAQYTHGRSRRIFPPRI